MKDMEKDDKIRKQRGRPKKAKLSDDDRFEEILFRAYNFYIDKRDGKLKLERNDTVLTLEDTAFMVWNLEGRKTAKPLCKPMMIRTERSALQKFKAGLAKIGITRFDDVFEPKRMIAAPKYGSTDMPE